MFDWINKNLLITESNNRGLSPIILFPYIAAKKPVDVPDGNWLPIKREDLDLTVTLRVDAPDLEKMKTWQAPKMEMLN